MVRIQRPNTQPERLLVGSDLPDLTAAREEIAAWVSQNGYRMPRDIRHLSVFEGGTLVREWVVVETGPTRRRFALNPFTALRRRAVTPEVQQVA